MPYERYANDNDAQICRIRGDRRHNEKIFKWNVVSFIVCGVLLVAYILLVRPSPGITFIVSLIGLCGTCFCILYAYCLVTGSTMLDKKLPDFLKPERFLFTCPHCSGRLNIGAKWECGWCSSVRKGWNELVFDGCEHATCGRKPSALRCGHCGNDIVLDKEAYHRERIKGYQRIAGVAVLRGAEGSGRKEGDTTRLSALERDIT